ncbi:Aste57867_15888 [Aphanomyces stellatus]|uniref:Aste57867_15888 protein n=1 Tax=Aphanomyces stellatus TaxID=120398 RepID=A0A485L5H3_9STRA|nr:hypothetical protein As57867_015832 [Aphanomyces stellatus]VFT92675.1 Aste57867_15888 [Aphanomyces stellatus]
MDRFDVDKLDFESVEPCRPSSFDGTSSFKLDAAIRARQALEGIHLKVKSTHKDAKHLDWRLSKKVKEVKVHRLEPEYTNDMQSTRISFRISTEVKAMLESIVNVLAPSTTQEYMRVEKRVFPKFLQCAVLRQGTEANSDVNEFSSDSSYPRHTIKWHASHLLTNRLTGRLGTPADFVFEEYVEIETVQGRSRGFGYMQSVDTAEDDLRKLSPVKCKRGSVRKGVFLVTPLDEHGMSHEVSLMYILDFPKTFGVSAERVIAAYTERLVNMREILFNTLFQAIKILPRNKWVDDRSRTYCAVCESPFTLVRSRHHCRACGEVICHYCSRKWSIPIQDAGELQTRLCTPCSLRARSHLMPAPIACLTDGGMPVRLSRSSTTINLAAAAATSPSLDDFDYNDVIHSMHTMSHRPLQSMPYTGGNGSSLYGLPRGGGGFPSLAAALTNAPPVRVGTSMSLSSDTAHAVTDAWEKLVCMLQQERPHFVFVQYSCDHAPRAIAETLQALHPSVVFCGNSLGVLDQDVLLFQEESFVRAPHVLSLWGLYDVDGTFATAGGRFGVAACMAKDTTRQVLQDGIRKLHLGPTESPDFVWLIPSEGYEDDVVETVSAMLDTALSTVGATSKQSRLCGMPGDVCVFDDASDADADGSIVLAMCCPSVQVTHAFFSCYEPNDRVFTVTKAEGKRLLILDAQAPLALLKDGLDRHKRKLYLDTKPKIFPAFGRLQKRDKALQLIEPIAVHSDLSMTLSAPVFRGDQVCLMSMDRKKIPADVAARLQHARHGMEIVGCFVSCSASIVQHLGDDFDQLRTAVQSGLGGDANIAITGSLSMCQLGVVGGAHHVSHSNGMVAALLITTKKKNNWRPRVTQPARKSF